MTTPTVNCPRCGRPLSPVLKGAYSHFPDARFCEKCVQFVEVAGEDAKARPGEGRKP